MFRKGSTMDVDFATSSVASVNMMGNDVSQPQAAPSPSQLVGFMVPGGPVRTDLSPADPQGTKFTLALLCPGDLPAPLTSVSDVVCFLLPGAPLPPQHGILLYWQATLATTPSAATMGDMGFELLGALTPDRPSGVFRTGWSQNEQLQQLGSQNNLVVTLGISVEPLTHVENLSVQSMGSDDRLFVAEKIATDLFTYMKSFDTGSSPGSNLMTVPTNIFDRWLKRFQARFKRDPNFFLKIQS